MAPAQEQSPRKVFFIVEGLPAKVSVLLKLISTHMTGFAMHCFAQSVGWKSKALLFVDAWQTCYTSPSSGAY